MQNSFSATLSGPLYLPRFGEGSPSITRGNDRTFFFGSLYFDRQRQNSSVSLATPTAAGRATLAALFPAGTNPNVDFLLTQTIGTSNPFLLALGVAPGTPRTSSTTCPAPAGNRPCVEFATFVRPAPAVYDEREFQLRGDHKISAGDQLSIRFLRETQFQPRDGATNFPGFDADYLAQFYNFLIAETHVFGPFVTNEARVSYNRIKYLFPVADEIFASAQFPHSFIKATTQLDFPTAGHISGCHAALRHKLLGFLQDLKR